MTTLEDSGRADNETIITLVGRLRELLQVAHGHPSSADRDAALVACRGKLDELERLALRLAGDLRSALGLLAIAPPVQR